LLQHPSLKDHVTPWLAGLNAKDVNINSYTLTTRINSRGQSRNESQDIECENAHNSPADSRPIVLMALKLAMHSIVDTIKLKAKGS